MFPSRLPNVKCLGKSFEQELPILSTLMIRNILLQLINTILYSFVKIFDINLNIKFGKFFIRDKRYRIVCQLRLGDKNIVTVTSNGR